MAIPKNGAPAPYKECVQSWWDTPIPDPGKDGLDDDIRALNALGAGLWPLPKWAIQVHRWHQPNLQIPDLVDRTVPSAEKIYLFAMTAQSWYRNE